MRVDASERGGGWQASGAAEGAVAWHNDLSGAAGGPVVQAGAIYGDVRIAANPPQVDPPVPKQLPTAPAIFTGRSTEVATLEDIAMAPGEACRPAIAVIVGSGGLGKTSLASHWLHNASGRYPEGTLYAELGGHSMGDAVPPGDVLAGFLRTLGVAPDSIPVGVSQRAALFRSATTGKRMAFFLDNAASVAQVRALLPGSAPEAGPPSGELLGYPSLVLVTARWRLAGLAVEGAQFLELGPFEEPAARELLGRIAGEERLAAEADASREVVRLCGGMPLAVCVSGARLAAHPRWSVSRIARELATERGRLSALSLTDDLSVRAAFDASYRTLPPDAARAYRMIAMIPGQDFSVDLATAVLDDTEEHTQQLLDALTDISLLTEDLEGRYHMHDLARLHAREQAGHGSSDGERDQAIARAVAWYLRETVAADLVVLPGRWRLGPMYEQAPVARSAYASPAEALDWLESRIPSLLATVRAAHDAGLHGDAWQLCEALWGVVLFRKHYATWLASHEVGLRSAQACADGLAEAQMHIQLGSAHRSLRGLDIAARHFSQALDLFRAAGHRLGEASALDHLGVVQLRSARYEEAIGNFEKARDIHLSIGRPRGIALMNFNIGQALAASGHPDEAIGLLRTAEAQFADITEQYHRARALTALGGALIEARHPQDADEPLREALSITEELGSSYDGARVHVRLADLGEALGQPRRAREHLEQALALFTELRAPQADGVRARLARARAHPATGDHAVHGKVPDAGGSGACHASRSAQSGGSGTGSVTGMPGGSGSLS
jgi:tetratricopeptide (TPR) repeat protein